MFFATCASVNFHHSVLKLLFEQKKQEHYVNKLHGKINQKKRSKIYKEFKEVEINREGTGRCALLLTTDLAARGIDIPDVDWII